MALEAEQDEIVENVRLRAASLAPRLKQKSVHDRLGELQPRSLKDRLGIREGDRSQEKEQPSNNPATALKRVETRTCDNCGEKGHLRRTSKAAEDWRGGHRFQACIRWCSDCFQDNRRLAVGSHGCLRRRDAVQKYRASHLERFLYHL